MVERANRFPPEDVSALDGGHLHRQLFADEVRVQRGKP
jgi:hypothetical protein